MLSSEGGELRVALTARRGIVDLGAPRLVRTYTYNNTVPGYTWEVRGGDTLRVHLRNRLPPADDPLMAMDRPHAWTTTNLHTHGLHVSPAGNADNVFLEVPPGEDHHLKIPLPRDHPGGIFWYHPHCHGAVTQQLRAGMAGALIVRGAIDEVEEVAAAREHVMVLQSIELGDDYQLLDPIPDPTPDQAFFPRTNVLYTVNGALNPTLRDVPGRGAALAAAERGRGQVHVAAPGPARLPRAGLGRPDAARPGPDRRPDAVGRQPRRGARPGRRPGRYHLVLTPGSSQRPDIPGMPASGSPAARPGAMGTMPGFPAVQGELDPRTILTVEVAGHGRGHGPAHRPAGLRPADPAHRPPPRVRLHRRSGPRGTSS